jgi:uncharacterized protein with ATP-grasp and redox domains
MNLDKKISQADKDEALNVMREMLKAARRRPPHILGIAATMILELAFMTGQPDNYIQFKKRMNDE